MNSVPQPRYSQEHRDQAISENRPLFTLDIYYPKGTKSAHGLKRTTVTGVLSEVEAEAAMAKLIAHRLNLETEGTKQFAQMTHPRFPDCNCVCPADCPK